MEYKALDEISDAFYGHKQGKNRPKQADGKGKKYHHDKHGMQFVMDYLYEHQEEEVFPNEIVSAMNVSAPRISAILKECEKEGTVEKIPSEHDKRYKSIRLSEKGIAHVEMRRQQWAKQNALLKERIGKEDSEALERILKAYHELKQEGLWK